MVRHTEHGRGEGVACPPIGSDVCASEHVQHALVGLAAEETAVVVGEVAVPTCILGVDGAVEEAAPVLLFGRVRERRAESSPDLHPVEAVDRAIPSVVQFASQLGRTSLVMRAVKMVVISWMERSLSRRAGWFSFRTVWSRVCHPSQRGKVLVTGPMIAARSSGVSSSSPAKGCL